MAAVTCTFLYIMCIFLTACVYGFPTKKSEHSLLKRFREAHGLGMPSNSIFHKGLQDWRIRKRGFGTFPSKLGATSPLRDLDMQDWLTYSGFNQICRHFPGACPGFLKGGSNISWFPKKKSSDFKRGGPMV